MAEPIELPPIYVGDQPPEGEATSLPTPNQNELPLPPEVARLRAIKTEQGLGPVLQKTAAEIYPDYVAGKENLIRQNAAAQLDYQRDAAKQQQIRQLSQAQGPLPAEKVMQILDPYASYNRSVDPDTVVEKAFSNNYVSSLDDVPQFAKDNNLMAVAKSEIPTQAEEAMGVGADLLTKNQYLLKKIQDMSQIVSEQSWPGYIADQLKGITQLYPEYKQRGLVDNTYFSGIGLGSNKEEQSTALYRKPFSEFKDTVDKAAAYLGKDNPSLAVSFLQSMYGQDTFEKTLDNTFTAMVIPDMSAGAAVVKKVLTYNQIRKAARDIVSAAARDPEATRPNMVAAGGDVGESAVLQVAKGVMEAVQGSADPLKAARTTLLTTWKSDADKFGANAGTYLSREQYTRIMDGFTKDGGDLLNRIETMNRVERVPYAVADENVIRAYKDKITQNYRGPNSTVLDVDGPFIEPASNTKWFRVHIGNYDATLLSSKETAEGLAEQLGIRNPSIKSIESDNVAQNFEKDIQRFEDEGGFIPRDPDYTANRVNSIDAKLGDKSVPKEEKAQLRKERTALINGKAEAVRPPEQPLTKQQGLGFYIEKWLPLKEDDNLLRDTMIKDIHGNVRPDAISHSSAKGTQSIINSVLGWVRNSSETLAFNESSNRLAATYAKTNIERWAHGLNKEIEKVKGKGDWWKPTAYLGKLPGKQVVEQFERTLDYARQQEAFFKSPGDLQDFYLRNFQRNPSYLETQAYFNYVKLTEGDRMFGEIAEFRNRARVGAEQHRISFLGPDGKPIYSDMFDGVKLLRFPKNSDQVLIMGKHQGDESVVETGSINTATWKKLNQDVERGVAKIVEVYDIDHHPLSNFSDIAKEQRIRYVFSHNMESNPISFNHVNRREGGHFEWDYDHYIKQADIRPQKSGKYIYVGDTTVMPIKNRELGGNVIKLWNQAHDLIKEGKWDEVRPIAAKLGIEPQTFMSWYKAGRDEAGRPTTAKLNPNEPMYLVQKGKNINQMDSALAERYRFKNKDGNYTDRFKDGTKTGFANNFKVAYNTERHSDFNFRTINDIGSQGNPIYAHQPANMVDPLVTMNRALNRAINSSFMDDYKLYAIEHWLREAEPHLNGTPEEIRSAPFWWYNNPDYRAGIAVDKKWNLESHRYKINTFVGTPSKFDAWVHTFTEHLADVAYKNYGPEEGRNAFQKVKTLTPIWLLHRIKNPVDFIRSVTFNFKLGLLNPAQFLVQAQTHALIWALEPTHGTVGTFGMLLHGWSRVNKNPAILNSLDNYYTKLNMFGSKARPGEFLEAMGELEKTGFEHVAGEYSNLSKAYTPTTNFIKGDIEKGLKIGQTPFRLGEQSTRVTAWYTAFRKFREENPTTPITNIERNKILNHADDLTVNMSRASSSVLGHGVFSLSSQFLSYQIKLAELFWSNRIDNMARARIITGFSLLYGFPNAIGVTGAPVSDNIRSHFMDDLGYIPGEKWLSTMLNEGYPAWALAMITGKGDLQKGNVENVGDRFGSQGWQNIKEGLRSDIPWWQALGGAGASTMSNFIGAAVDPFYQGALSWARGDTGDDRFTIKSSDLVQPFKEISTVSQGMKWWAALNTGKWINKNEGYQTDVSPLRATYLATLGMNPQDQDDAFLNNAIIKGEEDAKKLALKNSIRDWRRGLEAFQNGDPEQGNAYVNNAMSRLEVAGYTEAEKLKMMAIGNKGWESAIESSDFNFWSRGDVNKRDKRLEQYQRKLDLQEKRAQ